MNLRTEQPVPAVRDRWPVRTLAPQDWEAFLRVDSHAFGMSIPEEIVDAERALQEEGASIGAHDGDDLVGIATAYSYLLSVPGGRLPAAAVSWVGVLPTHRRRGVLSALMAGQLDRLHEADREPIAVLWASEPAIYGRFGYGLAGRRLQLSVPRSSTALRADAPRDDRLRLRLVDAADWKVTADVYAAVAARRPGVPGRDAAWWERAVRDVPALREGRSELRAVVAEDGDGVRGYARYSTRQDWSDGYAKGDVAVREVCATDPAALASLYRYLLDLDLMSRTELWNVPVDDPLLHWLSDPRTAKPRLAEALYVRLVDVGGALAGRTYAVPVDCVLDVVDRTCPWNEGRWRLVGGPARAGCERSDLPADLRLDIADLGAVFLGGTSLAELAQAGRVEEARPGRVAEVARAFAHTPAPWTPAVF